MTSAGGPALFGYCLDIFLYGILIVQIYLYYLAFPEDRRLTKSVVYFVFLTGTVQIALSLRDFYMLFCTLTGNNWLVDLDVHNFGFMWLTIPVSASVVAVAVHAFYAHRIHTVSGNKTVVYIIMALSFLQFVSGIVSAVIVHRPLHIADFAHASMPRNYASSYIFVLTGAICDSIIAIYMCRFILSAECRTASKASQDIITRAKRLFFETGFVTAGWAITYVVFAFLQMNNSWYLLPGLSIEKFYSISMLVLLNNRFIISGGRNTLHPDFDIPSYRRPEPAKAGVSTSVGSRGLAFIHTRQSSTAASGGTHTVDLAPRLQRVSEESNEVGGMQEKKAEVV